MKTVAEMLASKGRDWAGNAPATAEDIAALRAGLPFDPPPEYIELLNVCNGGEGELALAPLWFQLFDTKFALELWRNRDYRANFPDLFFFGSNGGLESIALNMRAEGDWPVVMIDCIAGMESAQQIAANMHQFIQAIGVANRHVA